MKNDEMHFAYAYAYIVYYTPQAERSFVCSAFNKLMKIESNEEKKKSKINTRINTNINCKEWYALNDGGVGSLEIYKCFAN